MIHRQLGYFFGAMLCVSVYAQQQHGSSTILDVEIRSISLDRCEAHKNDVFVAREGKDRPFIAATWVADCRWKAKVSRYHTNNDRFSLRVRGMGRSDCKKPQWNDDSETGVLLHSASGGDSRQLILSLDEAIRVGYARTTFGSGCTDVGELSAGGLEDDRTIHAVQFGMETLRLQVFENKTPECSLIANELLRNKKGKVEIRREDAEKALTKQDVEAKNCYAPVISTVNIEMLETLRFKAIQVQVD